MSNHLSEQELLSELQKATQMVQVGSAYSHYRTQSKYVVTGICIIEATQEPAVMYRKAGENDPLKNITWIRPVKSWIETVTSDNGRSVPRFQLTSSS